ncbi:hypothetical protein B5M43_010740 [Microbacterium sp. MEC084]|uniref:hypothetical protein n=1 Tax=Microbacterium sp. MEC084 TaxID=1963027 RepID=UPI00106F8C62|nr:hypothetical protein [Microbacterium sp. MEC084]MCD1269308.1 hypothetical protein [Microbacterium sp. MEC084]
MGILTVDLGVPYSGWPLRLGGDYQFGIGQLDPKLVRELQDWAAEFNANFDEEFGWSSPSQREEHARIGFELLQKVQDQLGSDYDVVLDPIGGGLTP